MQFYHVWINLFPTSYARGEKPFGLELESNPGPLASKATTRTTRPHALGKIKRKLHLKLESFLQN